MSEAVLALDQGSHATRAVLYDRSGRPLTSARQAISTSHPASDRVEHDAADIVASLRTVIEACLAAAPGVRVQAAGLATQRSSFVCVERGSLRPLSPVISWQDRRHARWLQQCAARTDEVRAVTGLPLSPHYGASKMRWCLDQLPAVRRAAAAAQLCLAPLASYLASALTGSELLADPANASRTLLWDSARLDWSEAMLGLFGISRRCMPRCCDTRGDFGLLQAGGQQIPLTAVSGDQSAVPFAFGAVDEHQVYLNLGTGAFLQRPLRQRPADPAPLLGSVLQSVAGRATWSLEGTVNGAASAVSWFAAQEGCAEQALWPALAGIAADTDLPIFINGIGGLGSPWWQAQVASHFVGGGDRSARFAALVESMLFLIAENLDCLETACGHVSQLQLTGGLSRSDWLCVRLAGLTGKTVLRGDTEATARGMAALAAPHVSAGWMDARVQRFEASDMPALRARRQHFRVLLAQLLASAVRPA